MALRKAYFITYHVRWWSTFSTTVLFWVNIIYRRARDVATRGSDYTHVCTHPPTCMSHGAGLGERIVYPKTLGCVVSVRHRRDENAVGSTGRYLRVLYQHFHPILSL